MENKSQKKVTSFSLGVEIILPADFGHNLAMATLSNIFNGCVKPYTDKPLVDLDVTVSIDGNLFGFGRISALDNLS